MKRFAIITLTAAVLTSCATADLSQVPTLVLCDFVLNNDNPFLQGQQDSYLTELDSRGEDCSNLMHLRRPVSSEVNVSVDQ